MACIVRYIQITFGLRASEFGWGLRIESLPFLTYLDELHNMIQSWSIQISF
jgi:hypothetical protein